MAVKNNMLSLVLILFNQIALAGTLQVKDLTAVKPESAPLLSSKVSRLSQPQPTQVLEVKVAEKLKKSRVFQLETMRNGGVDLGGGVTVDINNRPALRDLVDKTVCRWISGLEFQEKYAPGSKAAVEKLKAAHWYLGEAYEREIADVLVCLTAGPLKKIPDQDIDAVTIYTNETKQAAIRAGRLIFVDMTVFSNMINQEHRDFLFVHEITHSFIPFDLENIQRRYESLRSFVKMLSEDFDANKLAINIKANQLNVPFTTHLLDAYRRELAEIFNPGTSLSRRAKLSTKLSPIIDGELWNPDRRYMKDLVEKYTEVSDQIRGAILREDFQLLKYLLETHNVNIQDPLFLAYTDKCYYFPTLLQLALYRCGSQPPEQLFQPKAVEFILTNLNSTPSLEEIRYFVSRTIRGTPKVFIWFPLWETNPNYEAVQNAAIKLVASIPDELLESYKNDTVIQESSLMINLIQERIRKMKAKR